MNNWDFSEDGSVNLRGSWEFYWSQFLDPKEFTDQTEEPEYQKIPSSWAFSKLQEGKARSREGFATYRLLVDMPEFEEGKEPDLSLRIPEISSAYKLFCNGNLIAKSGRIGSSQEETIAFIKPALVALPYAKTLELVFHISNFEYNHGGFWQSPVIGLSNSMIFQKKIRTLSDLSIAAVLFLFFILYIIVYFFGLKENSLLYFALLCLLSSLRTISTGDRVLLEFFPSINWGFFYRIEYLTFYLSVPIYTSYYKTLYEGASKTILSLIFMTGIVFSIMVFFPIRIFTAGLLYYQIIAIAVSFYSIYMIVLATMKKKDNALLFLIGTLAFGLSVLHDILRDMTNLRTNYMASYGILVFIIFQTIILFRRFKENIKI